MTDVRRAKIAPSILSANVGKLDDEIVRVENADLVHVDVMDGHFVPNLTWGFPVVKACVNQGILPVDAHLMIEDADRWAPKYADLGCASVTFHAEAATAPITLARNLRAAGSRAAVGFRPTTPVEGYLPYLSEFDMILVMTVEPGFGGQRFLEPALEKIRLIRGTADDMGLDLDIQVDGGIDRKTIARVAEAGANVFVAGSAVYGSKDPTREVEVLRELATKAMVG